MNTGRIGNDCGIQLFKESLLKTIKSLIRLFSCDTKSIYSESGSTEIAVNFLPVKCVSGFLFLKDKFEASFSVELPDHKTVTKSEASEGL